MWFPETTRTLAAMGAEVILHPTLTDTLDRDVELAMCRAAAAQNQYLDNFWISIGYQTGLVSTTENALSLVAPGSTAAISASRALSQTGQSTGGK